MVTQILFRRSSIGPRDTTFWSLEAKVVRFYNLAPGLTRRFGNDFANDSLTLCMFLRASFLAIDTRAGSGGRLLGQTLKMLPDLLQASALLYQDAVAFPRYKCA